MAKLRNGLKISKRTTKAILTLLAALLTFGGPTYMMYILEKLDVPHPLYLLLGLASFTAGVILFTHLIGEEAESQAST
jgi:pilus assembly protein TadC